MYSEYESCVEAVKKSELVWLNCSILRHRSFDMDAKTRVFPSYTKSHKAGLLRQADLLR